MEGPGPDQPPGLTQSLAPNDSLDTATIHYVSGRSIRRDTVEMSSQPTTPLGCDELVPDHPVSGALAHVPESSDCQDLQFRSKRGLKHLPIYCSQLDFPENLGTGVDVNPDRFVGRDGIAGLCTLLTLISFR